MRRLFCVYDRRRLVANAGPGVSGMNRSFSRGWLSRVGPWGGKVNSSAPKQLVNRFSINPVKFLQVLARRVGKTRLVTLSPESLRPDIIRPNSVHFKGFRSLIEIHLAFKRNRSKTIRARTRSSKYCLRTIYYWDHDARKQPDGRPMKDICANIKTSILRVRTAQENSKVHRLGWRGF